MEMLHNHTAILSLAHPSTCAPDRHEAMALAGEITPHIDRARLRFTLRRSSVLRPLDARRSKGTTPTTRTLAMLHEAALGRR